MKVMITGQRGYIGSSLSSHLEDQGFCTLDGLDLVDGQDITTSDTLAYVAARRPDVLINLAGISGESACRDNPTRAHAVNALAPELLRESLPVSSLLIQASSASVLGNVGPHVTPYSAGKLYAERTLSHWRRTLVLRFGTLVGVGDAHTRWDLPAHRMIQSAVRTGRIVLGRPGRCRPWLRLETLCLYLGHLIAEEDAGIRISEWTHPVPLCEFNCALGSIAQAVAHKTGATIAVPTTDDNDTRDYSMPSLGRATIYDMERTWDALIKRARAED